MKSRLTWTETSESPAPPPSARLAARQIAPYLSPYLQGGYKQDSLVLNYVEVDAAGIRGSLDVRECFMPQTGEFHLTVPLAFIWVAQLGIIYGCVTNGLREKPGEIFLREINMTCKRPVTKMQDINVSLSVLRKMRTQGGMFYRGSIDIENKSFIGVSTFVLPLPGHDAPAEVQ